MVADENKTQRAEVSTALPDKKKLYEKLYSVIEENQKKGTKAFVYGRIIWDDTGRIYECRDPCNQ